MPTVDPSYIVFSSSDVNSVAMETSDNTFTGTNTFTEQVAITKATGTAPLAITSTTKVTNLNVDQVDGADTGTSGATIPLLNGNNTHSGTNKFGSADNHVQIDGSGEMTFVGTATVWDDLRVTPAGFDGAGVSDPALVSYQPGGSGIATYLYEFQKDDIAYFTVQLPHSYKQGEDIKVHVHWTPGANGVAENGNTVGWKIDYSWASINGNFGAMVTADCSDACDGTDHKHQMTPDVTITGTSKNISSMLICNIKRTDTGTDDTWSGTASGSLPMILEIDFHFPCGQIGSPLSSGW